MIAAGRSGTYVVGGQHRARAERLQTGGRYGSPPERTAHTPGTTTDPETIHPWRLGPTGPLRGRSAPLWSPCEAGSTGVGHS